MSGEWALNGIYHTELALSLAYLLSMHYRLHGNHLRNVYSDTHAEAIVNLVLEAHLKASCTSQTYAVPNMASFTRAGHLGTFLVTKH